MVYGRQTVVTLSHRDFETFAEAALTFDCKQSNIRWLWEMVASQPTASTKVAAWNAGDSPGPNVVEGAFTTGAVFAGSRSDLLA